jgi:hypothetical protein
MSEQLARVCLACVLAGITVISTGGIVFVVASFIKVFRKRTED